MIAGISTIGLTAVGVGVNIAQASKSNRLSNEIEMEKSALEREQNNLNQIQNDIAAEQLRQRREDCKKQSGKRWNENGYCEDVPGTGGGNGATVQVIESTPMPALDNPDGEIGKPCGDNSGGIWTEKTDGTNKCSNVNGLVLCECVKGDKVIIDTSAKNSKLSNSHNNVGTVDNIMELARYKGYEVQCNGDDEKFEFINDVPGADEQILRIKTDCNGKITEKTSSMQYTDTSGNMTTHATTVIICKCDKKKEITLSESGREKLNGGAASVAPQNPSWSVLEKADRDYYGITQEIFCDAVKEYIGSIAYTVRADDSQVSGLIDQGASMGYWCKQLGGQWTVTRPYGINAREWKCGNLDVVKLRCNPQQSNSKPGKSLVAVSSEIGASVAINTARENAIQREQNKDMNSLTSMMGSEAKQFELNLPTSVVTEANVKAKKEAEKKAEQETKREEERHTIVNCEGSGGWVGLFGGCNCNHTKGLTQSSDKKSCVCEKSGYVYDRSKGKCIAPNREDVSEFIDELEANSKDRFL